MPFITMGQAAKLYADAQAKAQAQAYAEAQAQQQQQKQASTPSGSTTTSSSSNTMINSTVDPFITQYRDAIERQRDLSKQYVDNQRRNDFAGIMAGANASGMMYSNFPERSKIQYNTSTYQPSIVKVQDTYRTGLDKLRSNTLNLYNQLASINEAIADLNNVKTGSNLNNNNNNNNSQLKINTNYTN